MRLNQIYLEQNAIRKYVTNNM